MGHDVQKVTYEGYQKYPGILATVITLIVGGVFLGALYQSAGHHDDHSTQGEHGKHAEHGEESTPAH
jgi:hypothetical protein